VTHTTSQKQKARNERRKVVSKPYEAEAAGHHRGLVARHGVFVARDVRQLQHALRAVALQVAFKRQILKPVFHLIGYRLWV
jgi:hypothetical protein